MSPHPFNSRPARYGLAFSSDEIDVLILALRYLVAMEESGELWTDVSREALKTLMHRLERSHTATAFPSGGWIFNLPQGTPARRDLREHMLSDWRRDVEQGLFSGTFADWIVHVLEDAMRVRLMVGSETPLGQTPKYLDPDARIRSESPRSVASAEDGANHSLAPLDGPESDFGAIPGVEEEA